MTNLHAIKSTIEVINTIGCFNFLCRLYKALMALGLGFRDDGSRGVVRDWVVILARDTGWR